MQHSRSLLAVVLLAGALTAGCIAPPPAAKPSPLIGIESPDFALEQLDGDRVSLGDYPSRPVLLAFWARGCPFCRAEVTDLQRLHAKHASEGLVVLAVNAWDENPAALRVFAREKGLTYPILLNGSTVAKDLYRVENVPTHVWIDRDGRIHDVTVGYSPAEGPKMQDRARRLLNPPASPK